MDDTSNTPPSHEPTPAAEPPHGSDEPVAETGDRPAATPPPSSTPPPPRAAAVAGEADLPLLRPPDPHGQRDPDAPAAAAPPTPPLSTPAGTPPPPSGTPPTGGWSQQLPPDPVDPKGPRPRFIVTDDLRRSRVLTLLRLPLAIPHIVWSMLFAIVAFLVAFVAWLIGIVLGRVPDGLHRLLASFVRYSTHLNAWMYMAANPFPGFTGQPGYPVDLEIVGPVKQPRLTILFRWVLAIPAYIFMYILSLVQLIVPVAWVISLILGRLPSGLAQPLYYVVRYQSQLTAYMLLATPRYPTVDD